MKRQKHENEKNKEKKSENHKDQNDEAENKEQSGEDKLSDLPDSILLHILSFLKVKEAIQTSELSTRWKNLWKHVPVLTLTTNDFSTLKKFNKFVTRVLSLRNSPSASLNSLKFGHRGRVNPNHLKRIVKFALSHNVNRLGIYCHIPRIEPSLFSSRTLKELSLKCFKKPKYGSYGIDHPDRAVEFPSNINLPALTMLNLWFLAFRAGEDGFCKPFSGFSSLNSLMINGCLILDGKTLCISSTTLVDLCLNPIIEDGAEDGHPKIDLYAPNLCTFVFHGTPFRNLTGSNLSSLKHLEIDLYRGGDHMESLILLNWLTELADHIESLTLSLDTLRVLSGPYNWKWNVNIPSFCNLKLLKVKKYLERRLPDGMVELLLQNAPSAKLCIENMKDLTMRIRSYRRRMMHFVEGEDLDVQIWHDRMFGLDIK